MFVLLLFLLCPGANPLNLSAETRYSPILVARNIVLPLLPRDGTQIPIHCLPRIYNIN